MIESPDILERLRSLVIKGGQFTGMFDRSVISQSRALELIDMLIESLPVEIEQARDITADREKIFEAARTEAGEIIDNAVRKAEKLVDADAITEGARNRAEEILDQADDYVSDRLSGLEEELMELLKEVRAGIKRLGVEKSKTDL
ncbi:MAG TPA: hypothetical protein VGB30_12895 [bacterium]|jgi:vacuolar-type H+-ATPase subunit H